MFYLCDASRIAKEVICEERLWRSDFLEEPITAEQKCGKLEKKYVKRKRSKKYLFVPTFHSSINGRKDSLSQYLYLNIFILWSCFLESIMVLFIKFVLLYFWLFLSVLLTVLANRTCPEYWPSDTLQKLRYSHINTNMFCPTLHRERKFRWNRKRPNREEAAWRDPGHQSIYRCLLRISCFPHQVTEAVCFASLAKRPKNTSFITC